MSVELLGREVAIVNKIKPNFKYKSDKEYKIWVNQQLRRYKVRLKDHQVDAVQFITDSNSCIVADEMGLGKTFSSIASVIVGGYKRAVFVVPASLVATWSRELEKFGVNEDDIFPASSTKKAQDFFETHGKSTTNKKVDLDDLVEILKKLEPSDVVDELSKMYDKKIITMDDADYIESKLQDHWNKKKAESPNYGKGGIAKGLKQAYDDGFDEDFEESDLSTSTNWDDEGEVFFGDQIKGFTRMRGFLHGENGEKQFCVMSYNLFSRLSDEIINYNPEFVCFDEAHFLKNKTSQRSKCAKELREQLYKTKFVMMTGTPITGRFSDLSNLLFLAGADEEEMETVEKTVKEIEKEKKKLKKGDDVTDLVNKIDKVSNILGKYIIRRLKDEVLNLPPKHLRVVWLEMTEKERKEYQNALKSYEKKTGKDFSYSKAKSMVEVLKWRQFSSEIKVNKIIKFLQLLLDKNLKIVIFCSFKETIEKLKEAFKDLAVVIDGSTSKTQRKNNEDLFQKYNKRVIIANVKTAATGFTWTAGTEAIFLDLDWTPTTHLQAQDRLHRIGQTKTVFVYYFLLANTIEEYVFLKNYAKSNVISTYTSEKNQMNSYKQVELKQIESETKKRPSLKANYTDYDKIFNAFLKTAEKIAKEDYDKNTKEQRDQIDAWEINKKTGKRTREAKRLRKQLEQMEYNCIYFDYSKKDYYARLYLPTRRRAGERPFITINADKSGMEWKTGERKIKRYRNFYIHAVVFPEGQFNKDVDECEAVIDEILEGNKDLEGMLAGDDINLLGNTAERCYIEGDIIKKIDDVEDNIFTHLMKIILFPSENFVHWKSEIKGFIWKFKKYRCKTNNKFPSQEFYFDRLYCGLLDNGEDEEWDDTNIFSTANDLYYDYSLYSPYKGKMSESLIWEWKSKLKNFYWELSGYLSTGELTADLLENTIDKYFEEYQPKQPSKKKTRRKGKK